MSYSKLQSPEVDATLLSSTTLASTGKLSHTRLNYNVPRYVPQWSLASPVSIHQTSYARESYGRSLRMFAGIRRATLEFWYWMDAWFEGARHSDLMAGRLPVEPGIRRVSLRTRVRGSVRRLCLWQGLFPLLPRLRPLLLEAAVLLEGTRGLAG